jgi:hypothetical protein
MVETALTEMMTMSYIKRKRINKAEVELMKSSLDPMRTKVTYDYSSLGNNLPKEAFVTEEYLGGYKTILGSEAVQRMDLYSRYETSNDNRFYKALFMIQRLRDGNKPAV